MFLLTGIVNVGIDGIFKTPFSLFFSISFMLHLLSSERMYEQSGRVVGGVADIGWTSCWMLFSAVMFVFRPLL